MIYDINDQRFLTLWNFYLIMIHDEINFQNN